MDTNTLRDLGPEPPRVPYWRRRLLAIGAGLSALALITWALSGALGSSRGSGQASGSASPGRAAASAGHATRPAAGSPSQLAGRPATTVSPSPRPATAASPAAGGTPPDCPAGDVVLSIFSGQQSFGPRQLPEFAVDVVSTWSGPCKFNVGARHLALVIRSGPVRIWSSSDCAAGQGSLVTELQRGVPTVLPISWNRQRSSPGCTPRGTPVPAGTYSATATDGSLASNADLFRVQ